MNVNFGFQTVSQKVNNIAVVKEVGISNLANIEKLTKHDGWSYNW